MKRLSRFWLLTAILICSSILSCASTTNTPPSPAPLGEYDAFHSPQLVTIQGYTDDAMEPFFSRDGRFMFFNNRNSPPHDTNLHYAEFIDTLTFLYKGELPGVNSDALDAVASMDIDGNFYFVSVRSYSSSFSTIYFGSFADSVVDNVAILPNISRNTPGYVNFDVDVSKDGSTLYFVDGNFASGGAVPDEANLVLAQKSGNGFQRAGNSNAILANINSSFLEYAPAISENQLELFFTRLDMSTQTLTICRSVRDETNEPFSLPERVSAIDGFVEAPTLSPDEKSLYYHKKENDLHKLYRVRRE